MCEYLVEIMMPGSYHPPIMRQAIDGGFQGRLNKDPDTCYAFWIGAVLRISGAHKFIDEKALGQLLLTCQSRGLNFPLSACIGLLFIASQDRR
ncbi:geranylgeranyl transferase type-1 subunit beta-like [Actinidia eriantha]|uniref:geranylgeranyl transferase type-1 subunit beta-like n=1 Tax=Actinidia eriantha TaxID=165200 RepID=UPI002583CF86|nr:geranylgeranyl transferase type-1 subunit beta-like [Actinidia eriantha]